MYHALTHNKELIFEVEPYVLNDDIKLVVSFFNYKEIFKMYDSYSNEKKIQFVSDLERLNSIKEWYFCVCLPKYVDKAHWDICDKSWIVIKTHSDIKEYLKEFVDKYDLKYSSD